MKRNTLPVLFVFILGFFYEFTLVADPAGDANSVRSLMQRTESSPIARGGLINFTFKSKIDKSLQPMLIKIPDDYTETRSWPLLVVLHGLGDNSIIVPSINSMVQIGPFGRGDLWYQGLGEQDVFECIELAKENFNIDPDRIYLCGFSMGGTGTFNLGLKHPDVWAACVPVCGSIYNLQLVGNANNLAFWINTGSEDEVMPPDSCKKAYDKAVKLGFKHWRYTEHEGMGHSFWIDWDRIEKWLLKQKKTKRPPNISFICQEPSRSYWAEITKKIDQKTEAHIEVQIKSQNIEVSTSNIADYILYLKDAPIELSKEVLIFENKIKIFQSQLAKDGVFNKNLIAQKLANTCLQ